jgi:hypothetical protein
MLRAARAAPYLLWVATIAGGLAWIHHRDVERDAREQARAAALREELLGLTSAPAAAAPQQVTPSVALDAKSLEALAGAITARMANAGGPAVPAARAQAGPEPTAQSEGTPVARTSEQSAAVASAHQVLDAALGRRRLSVQDVREMSADLSQADEEGTEELRRAVAVAVNRGQLIPEDIRRMYP